MHAMEFGTFCPSKHVQANGINFDNPKKGKKPIDLERKQRLVSVLWT